MRAADLTAVEAARAIPERALSAVELTSAVLGRVERLSGELNAYLQVDADGALAQACAIDDAGAHAGQLAGVPVCVKDVIDVAGMTTTAGSAAWRRTPQRGCAAARLRGAGAVILGKGHTNEFAYGIDGRNPHWGDCRNPYDTRRLAGGSSSGPAVAAASGLALAGLGTDTSGSIRGPASLCGLVGVRLTPGTVPLDGVVPLTWSYDTVGPLTRTVADARVMFRVLSNDTAPCEEVRREARGLRLGLLEQMVEAAEPYVASAVGGSSPGSRTRVPKSRLCA